MNKILVVEDDEFKCQSVVKLLRETLSTWEIVTAHSIVSALRTIEDNLDIAIIILDMSLPTYDVGSHESGGEPLGFGGLTVLQHVEALERELSAIVLTQYQQFGDGVMSLELSELEEMLKADYGQFVVGLIRYGSGSDQWKADLTRYIGELVDGDPNAAT